jgi:hypothetical protein
VGYSFLTRGFYTALSAKDASRFYWQLARYIGGFTIGIPVFVFCDYFTVRLSPCHGCTSELHCTAVEVQHDLRIAALSFKFPVLHFSDGT